MRLYNIHPASPLLGLVEKLWVFEADGPLPSEDLKLVVPNGLIKLVIPYRNSLRGAMEGWRHTSPANQATLIGLADRPAIVEAATVGPSGTIGIEFSARGAYRLFHLAQHEISNRIYPLEEVLGAEVRQLQEQLANTPGLRPKVALVQQYLIRKAKDSTPDAIYDHCIARITTSHGRVTVKDLERETGYSSRWLTTKFQHMAGLSPKNLASIVRFQQFYVAWAQGRQAQFLHSQIDQYYYDQSHFIKEFKRFTGLTPGRFNLVQNEFGRIFYQDPQAL